jgi:hypothetical protein
MKKVTIRLVGGLGNQLHCYAFGRAIAEQNHAMLEVDCESGYWNDPFHRQYLLDEFPSLHLNKKRLPLGRPGRVLFKCWLRIGAAAGRALPLPLRPVVVERRPARYQLDTHRTLYRAKPYFMGYWASYRYYQEIAQQLRRDLVPPRPINPAVLRTLEDIQSSPSCAIHWRSYAEEVGVSHTSLIGYYRTAVGLVEERHPGTRFFVFSDNPAVARNKLASLREQMVFVELKETVGNLQSLNDFYLMYSCDHAIIADSTFGWWAAWLSDKETKTIIAPLGLSPWGEDWLPPHWITVNADGTRIASRC